MCACVSVCRSITQSLSRSVPSFVPSPLCLYSLLGLLRFQSCLSLSLVLSFSYSHSLSISFSHIFFYLFSFILNYFCSISIHYLSFSFLFFSPAHVTPSHSSSHSHSSLALLYLNFPISFSHPLTLSCRGSTIHPSKVTIIRSLLSYPPSCVLFFLFLRLNSPSLSYFSSLAVLFYPSFSFSSSVLHFL